MVNKIDLEYKNLLIELLNNLNKEGVINIDNKTNFITSKKIDIGNVFGAWIPYFHYIKNYNKGYEFCSPFIIYAKLYKEVYGEEMSQFKSIFDEYVKLKVSSIEENGAYSSHNFDRHFIVSQVYNNETKTISIKYVKLDDNVRNCSIVEKEFNFCDYENIQETIMEFDSNFVGEFNENFASELKEKFFENFKVWLEISKILK